LFTLTQPKSVYARGELVTLTNAQTRSQLTGIAEAAGTVVVGGN
jgi:hypothetical protein